jgi:hypothetical protein
VRDLERVLQVVGFYFAKTPGILGVLAEVCSLESMWQRLKILLVFALVGPPVGGLVACPIVIGCSAIGGIADVTDALGALPLCVLYGPLFGYLIGFAPALLTGLVLAAVKPSLTRHHLARVSALSATISLIIAGVLMIGRSAQADDLSGSLILTVTATIAGLVAGNLCWRIIAKQRTAPTEQSA